MGGSERLRSSRVSPVSWAAEEELVSPYPAWITVLLSASCCLLLSQAGATAGNRKIGNGSSSQEWSCGYSKGTRAVCSCGEAAQPSTTLMCCWHCREGSARVSSSALSLRTAPAAAVPVHSQHCPWGAAQDRVRVWHSWRDHSFSQVTIISATTFASSLLSRFK